VDDLVRVKYSQSEMVEVSDLQRTLCREALRRGEGRPEGNRRRAARALHRRSRSASSICVGKTDDKPPYILYPEETEGFAV